jgi:hypothetical protein
MTVAYVTFPGTSGNYVSSADVNLLDADSAHLHQSAGTFAGWGTGAVAPVLSTDDTAQGIAASNVGKLTTSSHTIGCIFPGVPSTTVGVVVSPGEVYSYGRWVKFDAAITEIKLDFRFVNASGGFSGNSFIEVANTGAWQWVTHTATVPTNTARMGVTIQDPNAESTGRVGYISAGVLRTGATATFIPSLRIVGDLDMRARFAATDATPTTAETLIGHRSGNSGFAMTLGTGGELVVYHGTGSGTRLETSSGLALVAATDTEVRSVIDISAGTWTHYKNGVQFDTSGSFATTAGSPYAGALAVGADSAGTSGNWDGDIYYAEVRDGIDGPVVRRFDADDLIGLL